MKRELLSLVEQFPGIPVAVVGDLMLDYYIWGKVSRISPEAPVVVVNTTKEEKRAGGAGNVARNLAALGARVSVFGVVGDDQSGRDLISILESSGIDAKHVLLDRARPTTVKTRVIAHAQQVVRVDREVTSPIGTVFTDALSAAVHEALEASKGVVISDYGKGAVTRGLIERITAKTGSSRPPIMVDPKAPNFSVYSGVTVIKPNRREAEEASGMAIPDRASAIPAGQKLLEAWNCDMLLMTLGEEGMVLLSRTDNQEPVIEIDTVAREVFDVSGAGDTVCSVFTLALATGALPKQAAQLASYAAGIVVAKVGTAIVSPEELRTSIESEG